MPDDLSFFLPERIHPFFSSCNQSWLQEFSWAPTTLQKITVLKASTPGFFTSLVHFSVLFSQAHPELCSLSASTESCQILILLVSLCFSVLPGKLQTQADPFRKKIFHMFDDSQVLVVHSNHARLQKIPPPPKLSSKV